MLWICLARCWEVCRYRSRSSNQVRFLSDKHVSSSRIAAKKPSISGATPVSVPGMFDQRFACLVKSPIAKSRAPSAQARPQVASEPCCHEGPMTAKIVPQPPEA